ncbi:MFS transporter [Actinokineospora auranticolor]|uniref:MFS transporter n=1 Tax=Actinokineospora auranticolor TaxID=155976 RepID=A0A2S6GPC2_9PSEU|nr:MFS transporter [Actinokineospora auranticolor]PPK67078.1 MFS transporter [Actinokineospora auranticolor]
MTQRTQAVDEPKVRMDAALLRVGLAVVLGVLVSVADSTLTVVAIGSIGAELRADTGTLQWGTGGYLLANCAAVPASGWLQARIGARTAWLAGLGGFLVASVLCGLAWSPGSLIAFRVLQGLAGGVIGMVAVVVLTRAAGPRRAGRAFGVLATPSSLAPVFAPVVAGAVVDTSGWRWLFYGQVPLLLSATAAGALLAPQGVGIGIAGFVVGSLADRFGARPVMLGGLALTLLGTLPFTAAARDPDDTVLVIALVLRGIGLTSVTIPLSAAIYRSLPDPAQVPRIATISAVTMRLGGALGGAGAAVALTLSGDSAAGFATAFWCMVALLVVPVVLAVLLPKD